MELLAGSLHESEVLDSASANYYGKALFSYFFPVDQGVNRGGCESDVQLAKFDYNCASLMPI